MDVCNAREPHGGWFCTRWVDASGYHGGDHIATNRQGGEGKVYAQWSQKKPNQQYIPIDQRCESEAPEPKKCNACSLRKGHVGTHGGYAGHNLNGKLMQSWPQEQPATHPPRGYRDMKACGQCHATIGAEDVADHLQWHQTLQDAMTAPVKHLVTVEAQVACRPAESTTATSQGKLPWEVENLLHRAEAILTDSVYSSWTADYKQLKAKHPERFQ